MTSQPATGHTGGKKQATPAPVVSSPDAALQPDLEEARNFLELLAPGEPVTFQTFDDDKVAKRGYLARVFHGTLDEHADSLISINDQGGGVFVMVNEGDGVVHSGEKSCRTTRNVVRVRAVFVDLDGAPLDPVRKSGVDPHIVVNSSPGRWHAYWRVSDCPLAEFKAIQIALAKKFSGDASVNDLSRVMRLPGFFHNKAEPFMTRTVNLDNFKKGRSNGSN